MKPLLFLLIGITQFSNVFSQNREFSRKIRKTHSTEIKKIKKESVTFNKLAYRKKFDLYVGIPNIARALLNSDFYNSKQKVTGFGPIGLRYEYKLSARLAIGIDVSYRDIRIKSTYYAANTEFYNKTIGIGALFIIPNFCISLYQNKRSDFNFSFGVGYPHLFSFEEGKLAEDNAFYAKINLPVPKLIFAYRYFFSDNIGINLSFGLTPLIGTGISARF